MTENAITKQQFCMQCIYSYWTRRSQFNFWQYFFNIILYFSFHFLACMIQLSITACIELNIRCAILINSKHFAIWLHCQKNRGARKKEWEANLFRNFLRGECMPSKDELRNYSAISWFFVLCCSVRCAPILSNYSIYMSFHRQFSCHNTVNGNAHSSSFALFFSRWRVLQSHFQ